MDKINWSNYKSYFKCSEFDSKGVGEKDTGLNMKKEFMDMLYKARTLSDGFKFIIESGFRTDAYNLRVGGVPKSSHRKGLAADIRARNNEEIFWIVRSLLFAGFKRLHINHKRKFIHVDCDKSKKQNTIWD